MEKKENGGGGISHTEHFKGSFSSRRNVFPTTIVGCVAWLLLKTPRNTPNSNMGNERTTWSHLFGMSHGAASCFGFYELFRVKLYLDGKFCYMLYDSISLLSIYLLLPQFGISKKCIFITMFKRGFRTVILHFHRRTRPGMSNKEWQAFLSHCFYSLHYINLSCCLPKEIKCLLCNPAGFRAERFWWTKG